MKCRHGPEKYREYYIYIIEEGGSVSRCVAFSASGSTINGAAKKLSRRRAVSAICAHDGTFNAPHAPRVIVTR